MTSAELSADRICLHPVAVSVPIRGYAVMTTYMNNHLLSSFADNDACSTPGEVVHSPEGVQRQEEREDRDSKDIEYHPSNHVPFPPHDEDQSL